MKVILGSVAAAILMLSLMVKSHGHAIAQSVFDACGKEIATHCADVIPGNGRLFSCIYAHEDKASDSCDAATAEVASLLDTFFELIRYSKQECRTDIAKFCTDVEIGGGRVYSCLKSNKAELTDECSTVIVRIKFPSD